jgi:5-methyltetrahydrofolate--homocysteine methyltransferase
VARRSIVPLADARARRLAIEWSADDVAKPSFLGARAVAPALADLVPYIDWSPFFHAWELKGVYPKIFDHAKYGERARELFADGRTLLDKIVAGKELTARGVYGLFPAASDGDDIVIYETEDRASEWGRFHMLRQQEDKSGKRGDALLSLADFVAPSGGIPDYLGAFVVTAGIGLNSIVEHLERDHDDYNAIMAKALADRLAEAFAEYLHAQARRDFGYGGAESLTPEDLMRERYRGIRPAFGYPACPDHSEKATLWKLLDAEAQTTTTLTESFAMLPAASVSGIYFAHPQARYFALGHIDRDQVADYATRKGLTPEQVESHLQPNLAY